MNGPQHYTEGERHLSAGSYINRPGGKPIDPSTSAYHLMAAQAHFAAAQVAAAADQLADKYVGDGPHINEWRAAIGATKKTNPWAEQPAPYITGQPYSPPVETALRNLNLAGYVTPADTLIAASHVIAGHVAEALTDGENEQVRNWARSIADELKRVGLDLRGAIERRAEDLNGGKPFAYSDEPPF
ncbi:hypothetical protein OG592_27280 [Streptomyces avidinii]|uniref:hypothetical protein n=1 Tax=Streptomyces avidinii TaxID=1895 RepID=UPI003868CB4D|nr:hypothetical protein OG592_27280 [Streptomyces avidinii]